jgi:PTS system nitrogen regulatory IIA component
LVEPLVHREPCLSKTDVVKILLEREKLGSTGIGEGVAIPHGKIESLDEVLISFGRSHTGIDFDSIDGQPARLFFLLIAPETSTSEHLKALAKLSRLLKNAAFREELYRAREAQSIYQLICDEEDKI